jgi:membrane fusion protein (multidrug efflux system)
VWVDANFKETQLDWIRIGQPADLYVDMYGSKYVFKGRVSGFTMGTGSTLALLPAENATGNFVKVVQRLPVRIDLTEPNPPGHPLFVGLSVTPYVYIHEKPTGPDAGKFLQPYFTPSTDTKPSEPSAIAPDGAPTTSATPSPTPAPPAGNLPATAAPTPPGPPTSPSTTP